MNLFDELYELEGNIHINNSTYISSDNIKQLTKIIREKKIVPSILITSYLIDPKIKGIFELLHCDFDVELHNEDFAVIKSRNKRNLLSREINETLPVGVIVNEHNYEFVCKELEKYLFAIQRIDFDVQKSSDSRLRNAMIYYQIF